ncbi:SDR family NAD(P)-dependent oxidoreductase [Acinetobacter stercoris]|uniref:Cyclic-di-GMP-binding biofilm dispersal mediator protein n=1 Tax=Acinetobacter stercoris TaxID=2126983 RepID=A0A2U3N2A9_9GAMM|nr:MULTISPECIES: 3-oxoacyl-ACP reductase family protein [Acinetobacter]SPL71827.1 Cyclic-di-GMP-binding biofilm dispersal mediator protein [Acinetobacter stercoris]
MTNENQVLSGKVAVVTGGSRSIGASIAKKLADQGATVVITYNSSPEKAIALVDEIQSSGSKALAIQADAANPEAVRSAILETVQTFGAIDILVNNAGISITGDIEQLDFADYEKMIAVNVTGVFVATQEAVRHMTSGGRIIHIGSSMTKYSAFATASLYTLTKGAINGFTKSLARDLGPRGITVNTVLPGSTDTDMNPENGGVSSLVLPTIALGRYAKAEEIANVVAFIASPAASYMTGSEVLVDGGHTA